MTGTVKRRNSLDAVLASVLDQPGARIDRRLEVPLRLSAYQLLYLDRVPVHAAVDDGVELAKLRGPRAAAFVNAVLRRVATRGRERLRDLTAGTDDRALALRFSHPEWLVRLWRREFGDELAFALMAADNQTPTRCLRVNEARSDVASILATLREKGVRARAVEEVPGAVLVEDGPTVESLTAFRDGLITPQSLGSQLAGRVAVEGMRRGGAEVGETVRFADLCAAPGVKTTQIAAALPAARVVAIDADERRAAEIQAAATRLGVSNVEVIVADVMTLPDTFDESFAAVLLDAPCTGLGTLASRPDLRWRRRAGDVARAARRQRQLLERAARLVQPGGALTYSVCTLSEAESIGVVDTLLHRGGWEVDDLSALHPSFAHPRHGGFLLTLPSVHRTSGFFIARLRRTRGATQEGE